MDEEKVVCRTPTPEKKPTRIIKWKFDAVRQGILDTLPRHGKGVFFKELAKHVAQHLTPKELSELGSVGWYTATVKLELEVRGEIKRVRAKGPQRLLRC